MDIMAHRGFWRAESERNTAIAFERALSLGFGIETDIRDLGGSLVISHDIPKLGAMPASEFSEIYKRSPTKGLVALNIKSDGLYSLVNEFVKESGIENYFVFDMSVPDIRGYLNLKMPVFTRLSEHEPYPAFVDMSCGVWLDAFESEWYGIPKLENLLAKEKRVAIVSPELHRRSCRGLWELLKNNNLHRNPLIALCTDFPLEAKEYFNVEN